MRSREDAEDVLQNVFAKIAQGEDSLPQKENMKNWLFIITRNAVYDYYRKRSNRQRLVAGTTPEEIANAIPEEEFTDATKGLEQCLQAFIELLPERYKQIMQESELEGVSQKELATKHHMPYSSLRSRVQRGRDQLKQMLSDCCKIELDRRGNIMNVTPRNSCTEDSCNSCET